jgi:hypothetical protein
MASLVRLERTTNCLEGSRSIQLSYRDGFLLQFNTGGGLRQDMAVSSAA